MFIYATLQQLLVKRRLFSVLLVSKLEIRFASFFLYFSKCLDYWRGISIIESRARQWLIYPNAYALPNTTQGGVRYKKPR